jgi:hypothetical protein
MSEEDKHLAFVKKVHPDQLAKLHRDSVYTNRIHKLEDLMECLRDVAKADAVTAHMQSQLSGNKNKMLTQQQGTPPAPANNVHKNTTCHKCKQLGHIAKECPLRLQGNMRVTLPCPHCKKKGHIALQCWFNPENPQNRIVEFQERKKRKEQNQNQDKQGQPGQQSQQQRQQQQKQGPPPAPRQQPRPQNPNKDKDQDKQPDGVETRGMKRQRLLKMLMDELQSDADP